MGDEVRIRWVDSAKGIGIILVVIGHTYRGLVHGRVLDWSPALELLDRWIYSFHMPLFFFLTGLFLPKTESKPYPWFLTDKIRTIAYPYFIWSTAIILLKTALGSAVNQPRSLEDLPLILIVPFEQFWFLYVLFFGVVIVDCLYRRGLNHWLVVFLASIVQLFSVPWSGLHLFKTYLIYIALGGALGMRRASFASIRYLGPITVIGFLVPLFLQTKPLAGFAGISATVALAILVCDTRAGQILGFLGLHSLEIYVCHTIVTAGIRLALLRFGIDDPLAHLTIAITSGLLVPIGFAWLLQRLGFRYAFTIPKTQPDDPRPNKVRA